MATANEPPCIPPATYGKFDEKWDFISSLLLWCGYKMVQVSPCFLALCLSFLRRSAMANTLLGSQLAQQFHDLGTCQAFLLTIDQRRDQKNRLEQPER